MLTVLFALTFAAVGWHPQSTRVGTSRVVMKGAPKADQMSEQPVLAEGSVCEFEDQKGRFGLGVVQSSKPSAVKGVVYTLVDADDHIHTIASKAIHCAFPPSGKAKPKAKPADLLKEYVKVAECDPSELGVDVSMLELAWEECAEKEEGAFTMRDIMRTIDDDLVEGSVAQYKAHRLLNSDIGHIFFKVLHAKDFAKREFKAKSADAVATAKKHWCEAVQAIADGTKEEFCFA